MDELSGQVVIVGGGPVGLTLAMDLAFHGVDVVLAEQRPAAQAPVDLSADDPLPHGRHRLLLVRPDQHIAWRGDHAPPDPGQLIDHLRGADSLPHDAHQTTR
jgi:2-polyprenyl-6-methoxyphenol hydroxylase-like FAD-dependent oxidoreductase